MQETHCPICFAELESRNVAPCWDCGADPAELIHLAQGIHSYAEFLLLDTPIVLCNFCQVDFDSYRAEYFGQTRRLRLGHDLTFVRDVTNPHAAKDQYCPSCGRRLAFLRFLASLRERKGISK